MRNTEQPHPPAAEGNPRRRGLLIATAAIAMVGVLALGFLLLRDEGIPASTPTLPAEPGTSAAPATTADPRSEIVARLQQILRVRGRAIETRNPRLLESIYTVDCPCLQGDSDLIRQLRRDHLIWRGVRVSLQIEGVEPVNDRLWTVNALVTASPFRIEKESGEVVREMPRGRELSRFALTRPAGAEEWLLGHASLIERRD